MEIILSNQCESITGSLGRGFGYHVQKRKNGYFTKRNSKGKVPDDGHWRFILACAQIAQSKLHIADIQIYWNELYDALYEASYFVVADQVGYNRRIGRKIFYNARDIINLKTTFSL